MKEVRTNDEIISDFFEYLVKLPAGEYAYACKLMQKEKLNTEKMNDIIAKAENKRKSANLTNKKG